MFNLDLVEFEETSKFCPDASHFEVKSKNLSFSSIIECVEESSFDPDPSNPDKTIFRQEGGVYSFLA